MKIYGSGLSSVAAGDITDATDLGVDLVTVVDAAAARTLIGLADGTVGNVVVIDAQSNPSAARVDPRTGAALAAGVQAIWLALADTVTNEGAGDVVLNLSRKAHFIPLYLPDVARVWTNMPTTATILQGNIATLRRVDLSGFTEARLVMPRNSGLTAAATDATLRAAYLSGTSLTSVPGSYSNLASTPLQLKVDNSVTGWLDTGWQALVAGAQQEVTIALIGENAANGTTSPQFGAIYLAVR